MPRKSGFTLIEVLVTTVVTALLLVSVLTSFWVFLQNHERLKVQRELQEEARFALTRITDRLRALGLEYEAYLTSGSCAGVNQSEVLCLRGNQKLEYIPGNKNLHLNGQPLFTEKQLAVMGAHFQFSPDQDPRRNLGKISKQKQPKITVFLELESRRDRELKLALQTTLSSREY